jgi:hypothetical protein
VNAPTYIVRSQNVAARQIGDEFMIMSGKDSSLYSLNETAALLWQAADGVTPLDEIVTRKICEQFDIDPATALADARSLVTELAEHGILRLSDQPVPEAGYGS